MNDEPVRQAMAAGEHSLTRTDGRERPGFLLQPRAGRPMDGTRHSAAAAKLGIGGVDYGLHIRLVRNIAPNAFDGDAVDRSRRDKITPPLKAYPGMRLG